MINPLSPWAKAYSGLDQESHIKSVCFRQPPPLRWDKKMRGDEGSRAINRCLSSSYVPTEGPVRAISKVVQTMAVFVRERYLNEGHYLGQVNAANFDLEPGPIVCLTGLAGVGKSALLTALAQLLPRQADIEIPGHGARPHRPLLSMRIGDKWGQREIARQLGFGATPSINLAKALYAQGAALITQDEHQFMAIGADSHARQAKLIYTVAKLGPIALVGMNYSLIHKLKKRPQEERDRILREHIILTPDCAESAGWNEVMTVWDALLEEFLAFRLVEKAGDFWQLCVGIKRSAIRLLELAVMHAMARGEKIQWSDVQTAYASANFGEMRADIEALSVMGSSKTIVRRDLTCPFESGVEVEYRMAVKDAQRKSFFTAVAVEALPKLQREALYNSGAIPKPQASPRKPKQKRDAQSLIGAGIAFQQG